ncbi:protein adenylyltransferase SelO [Leucobacter musarum]|uniref:protein adenylyltransferase SelO n=1 Tax=Leucobacter musarum TaxID=1930747 RepID=UPI0009EB8669|nr:YdiU family protein [Leucobacter musarum]
MSEPRRRTTPAEAEAAAAAAVAAGAPGEPVEVLSADTGTVLEHDFASRLPELSAPWRALRPDAPRLLVWNDALAASLGIDGDRLEGDARVRLLLGNALPAGAEPVAQAYAGHQFGAYSPRLGDGRALLLGEVRDPSGALRDLHLKGSGRTPFSRVDGFAAVGPMLREHLMGEAMHALGVPTTRALGVVATGRRLARDGELLEGAVLARVASSHLRVGSAQFARALDDPELLSRLVEYALERHAPELAPGGVAPAAAPAVALLDHVIAVQAQLVAQWVLVGFVHGVMNTDNMTLSGETIDYGPCAFIDAFDPGAAFSSIDAQKRYAFGNQPSIALWNLTRFAESLLPLLGEEVDAARDAAVASLDRFGELYNAAWMAGIREKLGLGGVAARVAVDDGALAELTAELLADLQRHSIDYTSFFRALASSVRGDSAALEAAFPLGEAAGPWLERWRAAGPDAAAMDGVNPIYIPRNHLVEEALDAAVAGDLEPYETLLSVLQHPFESRLGFERYERPAPAGGPAHVTFCGT